MGRYHVLLDGDALPKEGHFWPTNVQILEEPSSTNHNMMNSSMHDNSFDPETSRLHVHQHRSTVHSEATLAEAHAVHHEFHEHEQALKAKHAKRQIKQRRQTQNRLAARLKIRKTKALTKVPMFKDISEEAISAILERTNYKVSSFHIIIHLFSLC